MSFLWRTMVGSLGLLICLTGFVSAQQVPVERSSTPPVPPLPAMASPAVKVAVTNDAPVTNDMNNVWSKYPSAVEAPGTHHLVTNAAGVSVHQFNMQPVVTNLTVLTNDLPAIQRKMAAFEQEMKDLPQRANILREAWLQDTKIMANICSNFVPADVAGQTIKARIDALEKELKPLREEMKKRLLADAEYIKAKAKMDEDAAAFKAIADRKAKIREERGALAPQLYQINELRIRDLNRHPLKGELKKDEPKTVAP